MRGSPCGALVGSLILQLKFWRHEFEVIEREATGEGEAFFREPNYASDAR